MGRADIAVNQWLGDKRRFADLFNGVIFQGKQVIAPEELEPISGESDMIFMDKKKQETVSKRYRDIVMQWRQKTKLVILACEAQDKVHYAMPVRNMTYDSMSYVEQVKRVWKEQEWEGQDNKESDKKRRKLTREEFLSRFRKDDRIYPVITLVFYYDLKKWDGCTDLYGMFRLEGSVEEQAVLQKYVPNYHINLVDAGNIENLNAFRTDLQVIFGMLKCRNQKEELRTYISKNKTYFQNVDEETYLVLRAFLHSENVLKEVETAERGKEVDMCKAIEEILEEGIEKGEAYTLIRMVCKKIQKSKSPETIAEELEEDLTRVKRICAVSEEFAPEYDCEQIYEHLQAEDEDN